MRTIIKETGMRSVGCVDPAVIEQMFGFVFLTLKLWDVHFLLSSLRVIKMKKD